MGIVSGSGMVAAVEMTIISKTQKNAKNVNQTERITSRKTNIQRSLYTSKVWNSDGTQYDSIFPSHHDLHLSLTLSLLHIVRRRAEKTSSLYNKIIWLYSDCQCGRDDDWMNPKSRIYNGRPAWTKKYPWIVKLVKKDSKYFLFIDTLESSNCLCLTTVSSSNVSSFKATILFVEGLLLPADMSLLQLLVCMKWNQLISRS